MNNFISDIKKNTYGVYKHHQAVNTNSFKNWLNTKPIPGALPKVKEEPVEKDSPEKEEKKIKEKKKKTKEPYKWSERFLKFIFLPFLIFIIIGLLQVCLFKQENILNFDEEKPPFSNYRPFRWGTKGTTWYGQWFGLMQTKSWSWLNTLYSKYFESLNSTFKVVEVEDGDDITSKIMKGLCKFWVILGIGFIYSIIWIVQAIFGWLLPGSQAFIYLFSSSEKQKEISNIDRIIGYIGFFISVIPVIFSTWILQLLYFPFLLWNNRKEKGIFNPLGGVYTQEQNGGIFTSIISSFLLMFSITFLLLGNTMGYAIGGASLLLFGFFVFFSVYHFYNMISKDTDPPPPDKDMMEEIQKKPERNNGTNFPTSAPASAPVKAPASAPVKAPASAPVKAPVSAPAPVKAPGKEPITSPVVKEIENPEEI